MPAHSTQLSQRLIGVLETRVGATGRQLTQSFTAMLAALPGKQQRASDLTRELGIKKDLAFKVMKAMKSQDPISALHLMPGPEGLRTILDAARRHLPDDVLSPVEQAIAEFEELVRDVAGDRTALDAILTTWLPSARARFELRNKQAAFKSVANLKGFSTEVNVQTTLVVPGQHENRCEAISIQGFVGLKRIRPDTPIHLNNISSGPGQEDVQFLTFDGQPIALAPNGSMLQSYCSNANIDIDVALANGRIHYSLRDNGVGLPSAVDVFFGDRAINVLRRWRTKPTSKGVIATGVEVPSKVLLFDALVHRDVWEETPPKLCVYDTTILGFANPHDASRDFDRLNLREDIESLGRSVSRCRSAEVPSYVEILREACERHGWSPNDFRAFRCRSQYPLYGSQFCMLFDPLPPPS